MRDKSDLHGYRMLPKLPDHKGDAPLNTSIVAGLVVAIAIVVCGALSGRQPLTFINLEGLLVVLGGTLASTLIQFSLSDLKSAVAACQGAVFTELPNPHERMEYLLELSRQVKERGILTLEEEASDVNDEFLRLGLTLIMDGHSLDETRRILKTEMKVSTDQAWRSVQVWETMGNFAPAMGLIGTLIGLIHMLGALQDPAAVGPSMAMALVATLYGSVSSNLFFFPVAGKLRVIAQEREQHKKITLEGLMSIAQLENPMMLEQRLQSFASVMAHNS